jgi:hypothetical protein
MLARKFALKMHANKFGKNDLTLTIISDDGGEETEGGPAPKNNHPRVP